jgi:hypothetical protein
VFGFTNVDIDLVVAGVTYQAATGFVASAMEQSLDLSVPNLELAGILDSSRDHGGGSSSRACGTARTVEIFEVNYADLTQGTMCAAQGELLGKISAGETRSFNGGGPRPRAAAAAIRSACTYAAACDADAGRQRAASSTWHHVTRSPAPSRAASPTFEIL